MSNPGTAVVPVRTIAVSIGLVLATVAAGYLVLQIRQVVVWLVVAAFFAVALAPPIDWLQHRVFGGRRAAATFVVFLLLVGALLALAALFVVPLAREGKDFADQLPSLIEQTRLGQGPVADLLQRTNAGPTLQAHQAQVRSFVLGLSTPATGVVRAVAGGVTALLTILVLAYLMALEGPRSVAGGLRLIDPHRADRIRAVGAECARSVTGYLCGNLAISVICGLLTYAAMVALAVPFAGLIAVFVAVVDLIPMIGATIGAIAGVGAALLQAGSAGVAALLFFVAYQQIENHLLQPVIYARTVKLDPLVVLIAILIAAQLAGVLGALLAIPCASMIQVVLRDFWRHRPTAAQTAERLRSTGDQSG